MQNITSGQGEGDSGEGGHRLPSEVGVQLQATRLHGRNLGKKIMMVLWRKSSQQSSLGSQANSCRWSALPTQ